MVIFGYDIIHLNSIAFSAFTRHIFTFPLHPCINNYTGQRVNHLLCTILKSQKKVTSQNAKSFTPCSLNSLSYTFNHLFYFYHLEIHLPFVLVFGGTDVQCSTWNDNQNSIMADVVARAKYFFNIYTLMSIINLILPSIVEKKF